MATTTGRPDDCSLDQLAALKEMIIRVAEDKSCQHVEADPGASGFDNDAIPPHNVLLRFLRARKFDVDLAMEMFLNNRAWRKNGKQKANTTLQEFTDSSTDLYIAEEKLTEARKQWQFGYHHTDNEGRPIYIDRIGLCDIDEMLKYITIDQFLDWHIYQWEECLDEYFTACSKHAGKLVETNFSILDLKGFRTGYLMNAKFKEVFQTVAKLDSDNYPECMGKFFIINAPWLFRTAWSGLKAFLDPKTASKITVLGDDYYKELIKFVSPDKLPTFLGGTCDCAGGCLTAAPGPWKDMDWKSPKRCGKCHDSSVLGDQVLELSRARVKGEKPGVLVGKKKLQAIQDEKDNHLFDDMCESPNDMSAAEMERLCEAAEAEHDITSPNGPKATISLSDEEEEMAVGDADSANTQSAGCFSCCGGKDKKPKKKSDMLPKPDAGGGKDKETDQKTTHLIQPAPAPAPQPLPKPNQTEQIRERIANKSEEAEVVRHSMDEEHRCTGGWFNGYKSPQGNRL